MFHWMAVSKHAKSLYDALIVNIHREFSAHGHRVAHIVADADPALGPVKALLGVDGILLTFCAPGQFAKKIESAVGHMDSRLTAVLASYSFYPPLEVEPYVHQWMCGCHNGLPNAVSRPLTPDLIRLGRSREPHYKHPDLKLFDVCMVREPKAKRAALAKVNGQVVASRGWCHSGLFPLDSRCV